MIPSINISLRHRSLQKIKLHDLIGIEAFLGKEKTVAHMQLAATRYSNHPFILIEFLFIYYSITE